VLHGNLYYVVFLLMYLHLLCCIDIILKLIIGLDYFFGMLALLKKYEAYVKTKKIAQTMFSMRTINYQVQISEKMARRSYRKTSQTEKGKTKCKDWMICW
jgi:hypothetical protein